MAPAVAELPLYHPDRGMHDITAMLPVSTDIGLKMNDLISGKMPISADTITCSKQIKHPTETPCPWSEGAAHSGT